MPTLTDIDAVLAREHAELVAPPVAAALEKLGAVADTVRVFEIDPAIADTATLCEAMQQPMDVMANCVIVTGRRGEVTRHAACLVLATTRADVNSLVRKRLDARKASFADQDFAVAATGMEYGGITPIGLPPEWPILIDSAVVATDLVCIGSGVRRSKLILPGSALAALPGAEIIEGLGR